jgi:hypothetical protein
MSRPLRALHVASLASTASSHHAARNLSAQASQRVAAPSRQTLHHPGAEAIEPKVKRRVAEVAGPGRLGLFTCGFASG